MQVTKAHRIHDTYCKFIVLRSMRFPRMQRSKVEPPNQIDPAAQVQFQTHPPCELESEREGIFFVSELEIDYNTCIVNI